MLFTSCGEAGATRTLAAGSALAGVGLAVALHEGVPAVVFLIAPALAVPIGLWSTRRGAHGDDDVAGDRRGTRLALAGLAVAWLTIGLIGVEEDWGVPRWCGLGAFGIAAILLVASALARTLTRGAAVTLLAGVVIAIAVLVGARSLFDVTLTLARFPWLTLSGSSVAVYVALLVLFTIKR
jgi:hypothetical protein